MLAGSDLCDTVIEVGGGLKIMCHAAVISCASEIVRELLDLARRDDRGKKILTFTSSCLESMHAVLNFIYTGTEVRAAEAVYLIV